MKRGSKILMIIIGLIMTVRFIHGQNMRTYDVTSGLSTNSIKAILQDDAGYIWCATSDGLNVFNGVAFKSYGCSYSDLRGDGVSALNILSILQHKDGKRIWVSTQSSKLLLFDPYTEIFKSIDLNEKYYSAYPPNLCYSLTYDADGFLWIATDSGLFVYDEAEDKIHVWSTENSSLMSNLIQYVYCDSDGVIWVGTGNGLCRYNLAVKDFVPVRLDPKTFSEGENIHIASITEGRGGYMWVGTWNKGLARLDKENNLLSGIRPEGGQLQFRNMRVRSILAETPEMLWICTNIGLYKYEIISNRISQVILSALHTNDNIYSCLKDKEGGLWFGTYFNGLHYLSPKARQIECYTSNNISEGLHGSAISSFCENSDGNIFIASENGGLSLFNPSTKTFHDMPSGIKSKSYNAHALCLNGQNLYVGTFSNGLKKINLSSGNISSYTVNKYPSLISDHIFSLYRSKDNIFYIGTIYGCCIYDEDRNVFTEVKELAGNFIYDIQEDFNGDIWFACYYDGLYRYDKTDQTWIHYLNDENNPHSVSSNKVLSIYINDSNEIYICTEGGGVCRYDYASDTFEKLILKQDGHPLTLTVVYEILNDAGGNLWMSSNNGIWVCDLSGNVIRHLTYEDGLQSNQYNFGASFRSSTGKLFFGGVNGFNVFNYGSVYDGGILPVVTVRINYRRDDENNVISDRITDKGVIKLPRKVSSFTMDFECLSYTAPHKNMFSYRIDDNNEMTYTSESSVTFLNFPYGKHRIYVSGCNSDGYWNENEIELNIINQPPLLKSIGANVLYGLLLIAVMMAVARTMEKRRDERERIKFNEIKVIQERETYDARINFFTHVAHEIKTPVTLIKAPLEVVLKNEKDEENRKNLDIIEKNSRRLQSLVNQLLDFRKISSAGYDLNLEPVMPSVLINDVVNRFVGTASDGVKIETEIIDENVSCMLDPEAYTKIISNLMTNAVKHAKSEIRVGHKLDEKEGMKVVHLQVKDDGCGIPESEHSKIFDTFYQINSGDNPRISGVGLGLSLVKLLVQKHNGHVYIDGTYKDGCCICVDMPFMPASDAIRSEVDDTVDKSESVAGEAGSYNLLVVEDTADMLEFVSSVFKGKVVFKASNGKEALEVLEKNDVDIIISDVSMPVMDGFEMLEHIRKNELFCHIPIIMLTVENSLEARIKGMECGADAYVEKPFSTKYLKATVDNLISRRETMRKRFISNPLKQESDSISLDKDREWFLHVTEFVKSKIHEPEISIDYLAKDLNMSRSSFQRKIKGLTGLSPVEFVRLIRLKKAAELLSSGNYRINEVSYMVGFNKPSYFSALFKKQFGVLPKDFHAQN